MAKKKRKTKKKSVVDSGVHNAGLLSNGCNPELVKDAEFDGIFEIPIIKNPRILLSRINLCHLARLAWLTEKRLLSVNMRMIRNSVICLLIQMNMLKF